MGAGGETEAGGPDEGAGARALQLLGYAGRRVLGRLRAGARGAGADAGGDAGGDGATGTWHVPRGPRPPCMPDAAHASYWAGLLALPPGVPGAREGRGRDAVLWQLAACSMGEAGALRALLGDPTQGGWYKEAAGGPPRARWDLVGASAPWMLVGTGCAHWGAVPADLAAAARRLLPTGERAALLAALRAGGPDSALALALEESLGDRGRRARALRRAGRTPGTDPRRSTKPRVAADWGAMGRLSDASRRRCARLLAAASPPAWAAALALMDPPAPADAPALRPLAAAPCPGAPAAAWALAGWGLPGDTDLVRASLARDPGPDWEARARALLAAWGHAPAAMAAAEGALAGAAARGADDWQPGHARALLSLHDVLPDATAAAAARLLLGRARAGGARHLVRHVPELATLEALAAAGLVPGMAMCGADMAVADGCLLRRRADGALLRRGPPGRDEEALRALRAADRALRDAWARALGSGDAGR